MIKAEFVKSAVWSKDYPESHKPEIAMVGRSNAGKSSLLNTMLGSAKVAKVSGTPGKTRLINFFNVGSHYSLVDLPGYGYAKREEKERELWNTMITDYFQLRANLVGIILVCDIRRNWSGDETMILDLAQHRGINMISVLTKIDKLTKNQINQSLSQWVKESGQSPEFFHLASSLKKEGVEQVEDYIFKNWVKKR